VVKHSLHNERVTDRLTYTNQEVLDLLVECCNWSATGSQRAERTARIGEVPASSDAIGAARVPARRNALAYNRDYIARYDAEK
jgi:hypothetical protein